MNLLQLGAILAAYREYAGLKDYRLSRSGTTKFHLSERVSGIVIKDSHWMTKHA